MVATAGILAPIFELRTEETPSETVVHLFGRLNSEQCGELDQNVRALISTTRLLILDMAEVSSIDSAAIGTIVGLYLSSRASGCQLKLRNLAREAAEILKLTRLKDMLEERARRSLMEVLESHSDPNMLGYTPD